MSSDDEVVRWLRPNWGSLQAGDLALHNVDDSKYRVDAVETGGAWLRLSRGRFGLGDKFFVTKLDFLYKYLVKEDPSGRQ